MKRVLLFLLLFPILLVAQPSKHFAEGRAQYDAGNYPQALEAFQSVDGVSAARDYNIGNTLMRLDRPDHALAYYRRAQWLDPSDPDLAANLARAVDLTGARVPSLPPLRRLSGFLTASQWQIAWVASCWLLAALGLSRRWIAPLRSSGPWLFPVLFLLTIGTAFGVWGSRPGPISTEGVLRGDTVTARFEPLDDATEHFSLPGGSVVQLTGESREWLRVMADEKTGWIPADQVWRLSELP